MSWSLGVLFIVATIAGAHVTKEQVRSVSPTVAYNVAVGVGYGLSDIVRRATR